MGDVVAWARLDSLAPVVGALTWPGPVYMYLERVPDGWLSEAEQEHGLRLERFDPGTPWDTWERGRIFCPTCELRWERLDGTFRAVYVGPAVDLPGFVRETDLDLGVTEDHSYALWGNRVPAADLAALGARKEDGQQVFLEFIVPRILYYPASAAAQRVRLRVRTYVDPESGALIYYRFSGLEEVQ